MKLLDDRICLCKISRIDSETHRSIPTSLFHCLMGGDATFSTPMEQHLKVMGGTPVVWVIFWGISTATTMTVSRSESMTRDDCIGNKMDD